MIRSLSISLLILFLFSCRDKEEAKEKPNAVRINKISEVISPVSNQKFKRGEPISFRFSTENNQVIDSVQVSFGDSTATFVGDRFKINLHSRKVGKWKFRSKVYMDTVEETHHRTVIILQESAPEKLTYEVLNTYPHDTDDYTQGLLIEDGWLYESTGQKGSSAFKKKTIESGQLEKVVHLSRQYFGEGLALLDDRFYQLTWNEGVVFVYDLEMNEIAQINHSSEAWGLANYNGQLIMTNSTEELVFVDENSFAPVKTISVYDHEGEVSALNELEVIEGMLYANVYQEDYLLKIDMNTGEVLAKIDMSDLLSVEEAKKADVLNGIAYDKNTRRIFVTGKWWPKLFEVRFVPQNP